VSARHLTGPAVNALWEATQLLGKNSVGAEAASDSGAAPFVDRRAASAGPAAQRRIGKYVVLETIGEGAMGIVYKATDPHIQRTVALKTIQRRDAASSVTGVANATRFRNEAQAAGRLSHPGIVSVYDYGEQGDESYIAMEYVQGPTLAECARRERLPLADVLSITSQLLDALQCAHSQNVWHRDIKPGNLILTVQGQLKVADFGIARIDANVLTQDAWSMGSPGYMAPECYTGAVIDHRVDLYACGVLLFELLTGARPFRGSPGVVMYQAMHEAPPTLAQALPGCDELAPFEVIVARAMAKQRSERYGSAHEMRGALHVVAQSIGLEIPQHISVDTVQSLMMPVPMQRFQQRPATTPPPLTVPPAPMPVKATPATAPAIQAAAPVAAPVLQPYEAPDTHAVFAGELTRLLQPHLGPMAAVVVKHAAQRHPGAAALVAHLAHELPDPNDRRQFLAQAQRVHPYAAARTPDAGPSTACAAAVLPVLGATPLSAALVAHAEPVLVQQLGPIGKLLVQRAAKTCASREAFLHALADAADDLVDRDELLAKLNKLPR
jgi:eukaryotic-like serine/threonine-protein kinase